MKALRSGGDSTAVSAGLDFMLARGVVSPPEASKDADDMAGAVGLRDMVRATSADLKVGLAGVGACSTQATSN